MESKNFTQKIKGNRKVPKAFFGLPLLLPAAQTYASNYALNFIKDSTKEQLSKQGQPKKGFISWIKPRLQKAQAQKVQASGAPQSYYVRGFEGTMNQDLKNRNDVLNFQKMLISQGYNPGTADGVWGKNTQAAYDEYMQNQKLTNLKPIEGVSVTPQTPSSNLTASFTPSFGAPSYKDDWRRGYNQVMNLSYMAKRGGTLVSRNPVKRFKSFQKGGSLLKPEIRVFKTGGTQYSDETKKLQQEMINSGITKVMVNGKEKVLKADGYRGPITEAAIAQYQKSKGPGSVTRDNKPYQLDYNKVKQQGDARRAQAQPMINNFNNYVEGLNKNASKNIEHKNKVYQTLNKNTKAPLAPNKDSELQDALWKIGAFKGIKNKRGKELTYEQAVDGSFKKMSEQALKNAENMGYFIDRKSGTVSRTNPESPKQNKPGGLASMYEMTHAAQTGGANLSNIGPWDAPTLTAPNPIRTVFDPSYSSNIPFLTALQDLSISTVNKGYRKISGKGPEDYLIGNPDISDIPEDQKKLLIDLYYKKKERTGQIPTSFRASDWKLLQGTYTGGQRGLLERALFPSPSSALEHSLGQWGYYQDENGDTHAIDVYDWNDGETSANQGSYTTARDFMGKYGTKASETKAQLKKHGKFAARKTDINLGKL